MSIDHILGKGPTIEIASADAMRRVPAGAIIEQWKVWQQDGICYAGTRISFVPHVTKSEPLTFGRPVSQLLERSKQ